MHQIKFSVRGDNWSAEFLTEEEFASRSENSSEYAGAAAVTRCKKRKIVFDLSEFSMPTVRHEVFHAFSTTLLIESANLSEDQIEEVNAELIAHYSKQMQEVSRLLYRAGRDCVRKAKRV